MSAETITRAGLAGLIRQLADEKLSGAVIIQTDTRRAIVLRYSAGKLVRVNARGNSVDDVLAALQESEGYKFSFSPMNIDDGPELMPGPEFIQRLGIEDADAAGAAEGAGLLNAEPAGNGAANGAGNSTASDDDFLRALLVQLAAAEIGPMAKMIVDQAIDSGQSVDGIIALVAENIPNPEAATRFTELAIEGSKESH